MATTGKGAMKNQKIVNISAESTVMYRLNMSSSTHRRKGTYISEGETESGKPS